MKEIVYDLAIIYQTLEGKYFFKGQIKIEFLLQCLCPQISSAPQLVDLQRRVSLSHFFNEMNDSSKGDVCSVKGKFYQFFQEIYKLLIFFVDVYVFKWDLCIFSDFCIEGHYRF